ncbi:MAG: NAD-dependent epimerase/dehydratase family protein [Planctomycetota bacterium]
MRVLIIGGTGLISVGIIKHLHNRDAEIVCFNRGKSSAKDDTPLGDDVVQVHGDRNNQAGMLAAFDGQRFDAVIDMIAFNVEQAQGGLNLAKHVGASQLIFCSTVCTYGVKVPAGVLIDETFPQEPISDYGKNKLAAERALLDNPGDIAVTVIRPSHTYGEGGGMIDQFEGDPPTWRRIEQGMPVPIAGDGLGLWVSTHRDDVGALFAHAVGNEKTFGQCYNATRDVMLTWNDYYRIAGEVLGKPVHAVHVPTQLVLKHSPERFGLLKEITAFHGAYSSAKAMAGVPEFRPTITLADGMRRTFDHLRKHDKLKPAEDRVIDAILADAESIGLRAEVLE